MILVCDVGNTNIVFAVFSMEGDLQQKWRLETRVHRTSDEYMALIYPLMQQAEIKSMQIESVVIASVVPRMSNVIQDMSAKYWGLQAKNLNEIKHKLCTCHVDNIAEVGIDRVINTISAFDKYQKPAIVIDFGTATTFDVVSAQGEYLGGAIAPGVNMFISELNQKTAKLPVIDLLKPQKAIGKNTVNCMQSATFFGYIGMINNITSALLSELEDSYEGKNEIYIITTGGLSHIFEGHINSDYYVPNLTIEGLYIIYKNLFYI